MITISFYALLVLAAMISLTNWRRAMYVFFLIGVIQDPIRKLTPGTPVILSMSVVFIYIAALVGSQRTLVSSMQSFQVRYPELVRVFTVLLWMLGVAALNGLMTFGLDQWMIPAASLFIYLVPIPAVLLGYVFARREEDIIRLMAFYVVITAVALIGVPLEYYRYTSSILGTVAMGSDWIRHLPGIQVRILAGTYRSPDIMAWHAATCCLFAATLFLRRRIANRWFWGVLTTWGFVCCLLSGRRKMIYMIPIFLCLFLFRYLKKVNLTQLLSIALIVTTIFVVIGRFASEEETSVYTRGNALTGREVMQRFEGGTLGTFQQFGFMGLGLGAATQGSSRFATRTTTVHAWQESGAGKVAVELGLPGFVVVLFVAYTIGMVLIRGSRSGPGGEGDLIRAALFGILVANVASFLSSHQPYSDPILVLTNAFFLGCFFSLAQQARETGTSTAELLANHEAPMIASTRHA